MKRFEIILGFIVVLSIVLRLLHVPGAGALGIVSFSTLSLFYYLSFALINGIRLRDVFSKASYKHTNAKRIIGAIGFGWALSIIILGALFKLMFWPGANGMLQGGLFIIGLILSVSIVMFLKGKSDYYKRIFSRAAIIGTVGLVLYFTSNNTLVDVFYGSTPEYAELFKKSLADPQNEELREELNKMRREMDTLEGE